MPRGVYITADAEMYEDTYVAVYVSIWVVLMPISYIAVYASIHIQQLYQDTYTAVYTSIWVEYLGGAHANLIYSSICQYTYTAVIPGHIYSSIYEYVYEYMGGAHANLGRATACI